MFTKESWNAKNGCGRSSVPLAKWDYIPLLNGSHTGESSFYAIDVDICVWYIKTARSTCIPTSQCHAFKPLRTCIANDRHPVWLRAKLLRAVMHHVHLALPWAGGQKTLLRSPKIIGKARDTSRCCRVTVLHMNVRTPRLHSKPSPYQTNTKPCKTPDA